MIDTSNLLFTVKVNHKLKNNNNGQTRHWSSSHSERKKWMKALETAEVETETGCMFDYHDFLANVLGGEPMAQKVGIEVHRVLGPRERHWDADSVLRGSAKQLVDSLVETKLLTDDNIKCILWALGTQSVERSAESHVLVRVFGAEV